MITPDKVTTVLGLALAALHQLHTVGVVPQSPEQWVHTLLSAGMAAFGYFTNKQQ